MLDRKYIVNLEREFIILYYAIAKSNTIERSTNSAITAVIYVTTA